MNDLSAGQVQGGLAAGTIDLSYSSAMLQNRIEMRSAGAQIAECFVTNRTLTNVVFAVSTRGFVLAKNVIGFCQPVRGRGVRDGLRRGARWPMAYRGMVRGPP